MFDDDLSVFYDTDEFAVTCHKLVDGAPVLPSFAAILSQADEEGMQGYAVGTARELRFPAAAATLPKDARLTTQANAGAATPGPVLTWRVIREGYLVNDGAESVAYLTPA
jgi:hypothetical protein